MIVVKGRVSKIVQTINMKMKLIENVIHAIVHAKNVKQKPIVALLVLPEKSFMNINVLTYALKDGL